MFHGIAYYLYVSCNMISSEIVNKGAICIAIISFQSQHSIEMNTVPTSQTYSFSLSADSGSCHSARLHLGHSWKVFVIKARNHFSP